MGSAVAVANPWTTRILAALQESVAAILKVGHLLIEAKKDLPHGEFQKMVERDLPFSPRQVSVIECFETDGGVNYGSDRLI
jgi:hypothetical protein